MSDHAATAGREEGRATGTPAGPTAAYADGQLSGQGVRAALGWVAAPREGQGDGGEGGEGSGSAGGLGGLGGEYVGTWGSCVRVCRPWHSLLIPLRKRFTLLSEEYVNSYITQDLLACFKPRNAQVPVDDERMASILDEMGTKLRALNFGVESDTGRSGLLLHKAVRRSSVRAVSLLLKHGANPHVKSKRGASAMSLAAGKTEIEQLLENASKCHTKPLDPPFIRIVVKNICYTPDDYCPSPCFLGDGKVTCALTGASLCVSDVRPGMKLRGPPPRNTLSATTTISQIHRIERTPVEKVMQIAFVNSLGLTPEHRIVTPKKRINDANDEEPGWVKAGDVGELSNVFVKELFNFELEKDEDNESSAVMINDLQVSTLSTPLTREPQRSSIKL
ncbi:hypothetical protein Pelo_16096 [Pelomyxa schiedti]|nr:hypothetical protein Pelo_16096 [Pelomyxa schiedti]